MGVKRKIIISFLVITLSVVSAFGLIYACLIDFTTSNTVNVYAEGQTILYDDFNLESSMTGIVSDYDSGWKTLDGRNASIFYSNGTAIAEEGFLF